jgi:DNA-binding protein HU-beta
MAVKVKGPIPSVKETAAELGVSAKRASELARYAERAALDSSPSIAIAEVKANGVFVLPGIGRLVRVDRKARTGRNDATGATIRIPAKKIVKFRVAQAAKDAMVSPKRK